MEMYAQVRRAVLVDGMSRRGAARHFGLDRKTIDKICNHAAPPGYRRSKPVSRPKLDGFTALIDGILGADRSAPAKQRHTAKRIFDRLCDEHGFEGGYTIVKDYIRAQRLRSKEVFVPLDHPPGDAQVDFGEAQAVIAGERVKIALFVMALPYSDAVFVKAYPAETAEALCEGHSAGFTFFGGVPQSILYDNTSLIVGRILPGGVRQRTDMFNGLISHYLFKDRYGRPGRGNDKGKVENLVGYTRRNYLVPMPHADSFETLNTRLAKQCRTRLKAHLRSKDAPVGTRLEEDRTAFLPLPSVPFEACRRTSGQATSQALVRFHRNDYSVPTAYAHRQVLIKGFVDRVDICCGTQRIARHKRSYASEDVVYDPLHYLALLEQKPGALDQAAPLKGWALPKTFAHIRRLFEARLGKAGKREYIQTLRLLESFTIDQVARGIMDALRLGTISYDAVKLLTLSAIEQRPARLDLSAYPHVPRPQVAATKAASYLALLDGEARI